MDAGLMLLISVCAVPALTVVAVALWFVGLLFAIRRFKNLPEDEE